MVNLEDRSAMNTEMNMILEGAALGVRSMQRGLRRKKSTVEDVKKHMKYLRFRQSATPAELEASMIHGCPESTRSCMLTGVTPLPTRCFAARPPLRVLTCRKDTPFEISYCSNPGPLSAKYLRSTADVVLRSGLLSSSFQPRHRASSQEVLGSRS